jgi:4-amino-4-deoxy-L-arabinose transferase-like glycosyltransferase
MDQQSFRSARIRSGVSFFSLASQRFSWRLLVFFLVLIYVPFLGSRSVRPAGDDKVYVSQSIEMAQQGNWFVQSLGGEPNYYKGPLHYLLVRIGMKVFGDSMWATVWMNFLLVILGALALGAIVHRNMREFEGWSFWAAMAFATCAGIYSHVFASQMEVETAAIFCIGLYLLDKSGPGAPDFKFWILAGLVGWLKSPLHSVLLGTTALCFWATQRELWPRATSGKAWLAALTGILVCCLGYAPAFFLDRQNFIDTYILRETLHKPANGAPWHYPIIPLFTYSLLPWLLPALVAYADGISRIWRKQRAIRVTAGSRRVITLGLALIAPSVLFFLWHPYRGQNYNLPVIGGLILVVGALWATRAETWTKAYSMSLALTAFVLLIVPIALTYFTQHFDPMPFWWPSWLMPVLWMGTILTVRGFWREGVTFNMARPASLARRYLWFLLGLGAFLITLGEREMIDIRDRLYEARKVNETLSVSYYNLQKNIWSEWGYLNFQIPYPVRSLDNDAELFEAVRKNDLILVPGEHWLDEMKSKVEKEFPKAEWTIEPWRRWKTKGKNAQGQTAWSEAWQYRDLSKVEKLFYMVRVRNH